MMQRFVLMIALAIAALPLSAQVKEGDLFVGIFLRTCMEYLYKQDQLPAFMAASGAKALTPEQARFFLTGNPGKAWDMPSPPGTHYVVSLADKGICAAYARTGNVSQIEYDFKNAVGKAPPPLKSLNIPLPPNSNRHLRSLSYNWVTPKDNANTINFRLSYSLEKEPTVRALITAAEICH